MPRSSEVLIARLRNRTKRIIICGVLTVVLSVMLIAIWLLIFRMSATLTPKEGDDQVFHLVVCQPLILGIANCKR